MFSKKKVNEPLLDETDAGVDGEVVINTKIPLKLAEAEMMETQEQASMRRTIKLNYKKYSLAEDPAKKEILLAQRTKYEVDKNIDIDLQGGLDQNAINEYFFENKEYLGLRPDVKNQHALEIEKEDDYEGQKNDDEEDDNDVLVDKIDTIEYQIEAAQEKRNNMKQQRDKKEQAYKKEKEEADKKEKQDKKIQMEKGSGMNMSESILEKEEKKVELKEEDIENVKKELELYAHNLQYGHMTPFQKLSYKLDSYILKELEEMKMKIMTDVNYAYVTCSNGHLLSHFKRDTKQGDCRKCFQPSINQQMSGYYKCIHPDCDPSKNHDLNCKELTHLACQDSFDYLVCRACAFGEEGHLQQEMTQWYHSHKLKRHGIRHQAPWSCCMESPEMQYQMVRAGFVDKKKGLEKKCINGISSKLSNPLQNQGWGCTECDFDICVDCLKSLWDSKEKMKLFEKETRRAERKLQFEQGEISDCEDTDEEQEGDQEENQDDQENKREQKEKNTITDWEHSDIVHCRSPQEEIDMIKAKKPEDLYENMLNDFIDRGLTSKKLKSQKILRQQMKVFNYEPCEDDYNFMLEGVPKATGFSNPIEIKHKEIQIILRPKSQEYYVIVKTIEQINNFHTKGHGHNLIKALRVYKFAEDPQPRMVLIDSFLLEQVEGSTFQDNMIINNQISIIKNQYKIYFWRRRKNEMGNYQMQLWRYNIEEDEEKKEGEEQKKKLSQVIFKDFMNKDGEISESLDLYSLEAEQSDCQDGQENEEEKKKDEGFFSQGMNFLKKASKKIVKVIGGIEVEVNKKGTNQYHLLFAQQLGHKPKNPFNWSPEQKKANDQREKDYINKVEDNEDDTKERIKAAKKDLQTRREEQDEKLFIDSQFIIKQYYYPQESKYQVALEAAEKKDAAEKKEKENAQLDDNEGDNEKNEDGGEKVGEEDAGEKKDEEEKEEQKVQEYSLSRLDHIKWDLIQAENNGSTVPITNCFFRHEKRVKELTDEQKMDPEFENVSYNWFTFTFWDDKVSTFQYSDLKEEKRKGPKIHIEPEEMPTTHRWIQNGSEVQWQDIKLSAFNPRVYYLLSIELDEIGKQMKKVVLIEPAWLESKSDTEAVVQAITKQLVADNLFQNDEDDSAEVILVQSNRLFSQEINKNKMMIKSPNKKFLSNLIQKQSNTLNVETKEGFVSNLNKVGAKVKYGILNNLFMDVFFINPYSDNQHIECIFGENNNLKTLIATYSQGASSLNFSEDKCSKEQRDLLANRDQKDMLNLIFKTESQEVIFRNSEWERSYSTFNQINFMVTKEDKLDKDKDEEQYSDYDSDYDSSEDESEQESQQESESGEEKPDKVEEVLLYPYDQIAKGFLRMKDNYIQKNYIYVEDQRPDKQYPGRMKRILIVPPEKVEEIEDPNNQKKAPDVIKAICYYQSEENYVFLFSMNHYKFFFYVIDVTNIFELDQDREIKDQSLLKENTKIYFVNTQKTTKKMSLSELRTINEKDAEFSIYCKVQKVIDHQEKLDFFPFIAFKVSKAEVTKAGEDCESCRPDALNFNSFSVLSKSIKASAAANIQTQYMQDITIYDVKLCQSTSVQTKQVEKTPDRMQVNKKQVKRTTQMRFMIAFHLKKTAKRILFKEIQVISKLQGLKMGRILRPYDSTDSQCVLQVGQRELMPNQTEKNFFKIGDYEIIPFLQSEQECYNDEIRKMYCDSELQSLETYSAKPVRYNVKHVKGIQVVLKQQASKKDVKGKDRFQIITILDSTDLNNVFHYESEIAFIGVSKFFNIWCTGKKNDIENTSFYTLTSARIKQRQMIKSKLDECETLIILRDLISTQQHMVEFNFSLMATSNFNNIRTKMFFLLHEFLLGQSMVTVHLNEFDTIMKIMMMPGSDDMSPCTLGQTLGSDPERIEYYQKNKIFREATMVQTDFNVNHQLQKAFALNEALVQKRFIEEIFKENSECHKTHMMMVLGDILTDENYNQNVDYFLSFFQREKITEFEQACKMETFLFNKKLPIKSDVESNNMEFLDFDDPNQVNEFIVKQICDDDSKKNKDDKSVTVEHSMMDFQWMILAIKLKNLGTDEEMEEQFGKLFFSNMMVQGNSINFYLQDMTKKFIDYQFVETYNFFLRNLSIYVLLFLMPFLAVIFDPELKYALFVCLACQVYFLFWEVLQMKVMKLEYFKSMQNWTELGQFFMFSCILFKKFYWPNDDSIPPWERIMQMLIVMQAFLKILFFLKIFSDYGFLVQMITTSISDITGFLIFFVMWIVFFAIQYQILQAEFGLDDYTGLPHFTQLLIISFRNSIGDIQMAGYTKLLTQATIEAYGIIFLIWVYWFMNIGLMCIILMNFLIAVISDSYANVNGQKEEYVYKDKSEMNQECQQLLNMIYPQQDLKIVSFSRDKSSWVQNFSAFIEILENTEDQVLKLKDYLTEKIDDLGAKLQLQIETMQKKQLYMFEVMGKSTGQASIAVAASTAPSEAIVDMTPVISAQDKMNQRISNVQDSLDSHTQNFESFQKDSAKNVNADKASNDAKKNINELREAITKMIAENQQEVMKTIAQNQDAAMKAQDEAVQKMKQNHDASLKAIDEVKTTAEQAAASAAEAATAAATAATAATAAAANKEEEEE